MALQVEAARYQLGQLLGGDRGRRLAQHAEAALSAQGVRVPGRFASMLCPGRFEAPGRASTGSVAGCGRRWGRVSEASRRATAGRRPSRKTPSNTPTTSCRARPRRRSSPRPARRRAGSLYSSRSRIRSSQRTACRPPAAPAMCTESGRCRRRRTWPPGSSRSSRRQIGSQWTARPRARDRTARAGRRRRSTPGPPPEWQSSPDARHVAVRVDARTCPRRRRLRGRTRSSNTRRRRCSPSPRGDTPRPAHVPRYTRARSNRSLECRARWPDCTSARQASMVEPATGSQRPLQHCARLRARRAGSRRTSRGSAQAPPAQWTEQQSSAARAGEPRAARTWATRYARRIERARVVVEVARPPRPPRPAPRRATRRARCLPARTRRIPNSRARPSKLTNRALMAACTAAQRAASRVTGCDLEDREIVHVESLPPRQHRRSHPGPEVEPAAGERDVDGQPRLEGDIHGGRPTTGDASDATTAPSRSQCSAPPSEGSIASVVDRGHRAASATLSAASARVPVSARLSGCHPGPNLDVEERPPVARPGRRLHAEPGLERRRRRRPARGADAQLRRARVAPGVEAPKRSGGGATTVPRSSVLTERATPAAVGPSNGGAWSILRALAWSEAAS